METDYQKKRFFDVGAYLTTPTFKGVYDGIKEHDSDLNNVLARAWKRGINRIIIPGINVNVSRESIEIARLDERLYSTVGCSPARSHEFDKEGPEEYINILSDLIKRNRQKVIGYGEIGLDYRWLEVCDKDTQMKYFLMQLDLAKSLKLPLFLNARNSVPDVLAVLKRQAGDLGVGGVIHSFDGTEAEAKALVDLGYYLGITGCSLRTEDNLMMVKSIPNDRILLESNSPWCLLKPLHAGYRYIKTTYPARAKFHWSPDSMVRGRNEPANVNQVLEAVAAVKGEDPNILADIIYKNSERLFLDNRTEE